MKRYLSALAAIAVLSTTFPVGAVSNEENPADLFALHNVEIVFHQAASTKDLDLMMSLFADGATLSTGGKTYIGKDQVRSYFATVAGSFQPLNKWIAYTPAQRIRINISDDQAHLYFEPVGRNSEAYSANSVNRPVQYAALIALVEANRAITPRLRWLTDLPVVPMCRGYRR